MQASRRRWPLAPCGAGDSAGSMTSLMGDDGSNFVSVPRVRLRKFGTPNGHYWALFGDVVFGATAQPAVTVPGHCLVDQQARPESSKTQNGFKHTPAGLHGMTSRILQEQTWRVDTSVGDVDCEMHGGPQLVPVSAPLLFKLLMIDRSGGRDYAVHCDLPYRRNDVRCSCKGSGCSWRPCPEISAGPLC